MATKKPETEKVAVSGTGFTLGDVTKLVESLAGSDVRSLVWTRGDEKIAIRRGQAPVKVVTPPGPVAAAGVPAPLPVAAPPSAPAPSAPAAPASTMVCPVVRAR